MTTEAYTATVLDHFTCPRNVGEVRGSTHAATVENPACGDLIKLTLRVEGGVVRDAKMKTFGCAAAIASASMMTTLIEGRPVAEARGLSNAAVVAALGGLPEHKVKCSVLAEDVLRKALG